MKVPLRPISHQGEPSAGHMLGEHKLGTAVVWLWGIVSLYPLIWMTIQSVRPDIEFFTNTWGLPGLSGFTLKAYQTAFDVANMATYYRNSIIVSTSTVALVLVLSTMCGYALSRLEFPGRRSFGGLVFLIMAFPGAVLLLPLFLVTYRLGMLNSRLALILPYTVFTLPIAIYLLKSSFDSLPREIFEAARVDGAGEWRLFWNVAVPLVPGAIGTAGFLSFMPVWDEFIWALVTLRDEALFTLPVGLVTLADKRFQFGYNTSFAGMVVTALPVVIALVISQRSFIRAVTAGAVKG